MDVLRTDLPGVLVFRPRPHRDERGFFSRTYDARVAARWGMDRADFVQDSQSRSAHGVLRGLHGRGNGGEAKLIRCAHGAMHLVVVDGRIESATLGRHVSILLDDQALESVYVPRGMLVGFQVVGEVADVCYSIDREHEPADDVSVAYDDPALGIAWPLPAGTMSPRDERAPSWAQYLAGQQARDGELVRPGP